MEDARGSSLARDNGIQRRRVPVLWECRAGDRFESHFRMRISLKYRDLVSIRTHPAESSPLLALQPAALARLSVPDRACTDNGTMQDGMSMRRLRFLVVSGVRCLSLTTGMTHRPDTATVAWLNNRGEPRPELFGDRWWVSHGP